MWALAAYHHATAAEWVDFLRALETTSPPRLVITDGADELGNAARQVWPARPSPSFPVPFLSRCEHHLRENVGEELAADRVDHWGSARMNVAQRRVPQPRRLGEVHRVRVAQARQRVEVGPDVLT